MLSCVAGRWQQGLVLGHMLRSTLLHHPLEQRDFAGCWTLAVVTPEFNMAGRYLFAHKSQKARGPWDLRGPESHMEGVLSLSHLGCCRVSRPR